MLQLLKGGLGLDRKKTILLLSLGFGAPLVSYTLFRRWSRTYSGRGSGEVQHASTSFESYLKDGGGAVKANAKRHAPTSFESYLKENTVKGSKENTSVPVAEEVGSGNHVKLPRVLVVYGTEYGFSKEVAEELKCRIKQTENFMPVLVNMADIPEGLKLQKEQVALFVCSTQGDGVPPSEARPFCDWLFSGAAGKLEDLHYSVLALGDKSYTHFCRCGVMIDGALQSSGGHELVGRAEVNKEDWRTINKWMDEVLGALPGLGLTVQEGEEDNLTAAAPVARRRWGKSRPFPARIVAIEGLCAVRGPEDKDTVRVELDIGESGLSYLPGDALGIYPRNRDEAVGEFLEALHAVGDELVSCPTWWYGRTDDQGGEREEMPLREALTCCYDLKTPKEEIFSLLLAAHRGSLKSEASGNAHGRQDSDVVLNTYEDSPGGQKVDGKGDCIPQHMRGLTAVKLLEELVSSCQEGSQLVTDYLYPRHLVDILHELWLPSMSHSQVLPMLRPLLPRLYSISSAPMENPTTVQVTIAVVKYASLDKDRFGVCSTHVCETMKVGDVLPVYMHPNPDFRLPPSASTPIIMVGPGTGLAPFRGFILERLQGEEASGPMLLFFGCRRRDQDYLYGSQLDQWAAQQVITLETACSREQQEKVYVQNKLRERGDLVWSLLRQGGHFYVCGDAHSMAGAVDLALRDVLREHGGMGDEEVDRYLQDLSQAGRYQRDVWF